MKTLKIVSLLLLVTVVMVFASSCYVGMGTTMKKAKGTYELTGYSITDGKTGTSKDKLAADGIKSYLVVTGDSKGYYVYQDSDTAAFYREVYLSYEYSEDGKTVNYLTYRFEGQSADDAQRVGINSGSLNYSRPHVKLSELVYSDGISMSWTKVSSAIDLSYAESQIGTISPYEAPQ
ncbi:MAG: hypothetical protein J6R40_05915 [Clostridia bacterium]|nr:hypothetical protein [Clostridia bacterium]